MDDPTFAARNNMATTVNDNYNAAALLTPEEDLGISPSARRTLSAQRVAVVMNSDGSIAKPHSDVQVRPHAPIRPSEAELHHPTVAAPAYDTSSSTNTAVSAPGNKQEGDVTPPLPLPPPQLAGAPVDADAIYESEVTKKPEDDLRVADVEELTKKGINLDSRGVIINGLTREDVWALLRRFDKQIRHVREIEAPKKGRLDLKTAADDQFAPEKLRANLERLYLTVVLSLVSLSKHLGRLSNWEDQYRTATFCVAYFVFWFFNLLIPAFLTLLAVLIAVPPARTILFPPTKLAVVHPYDGGNAPALPANGEIHSDDTLTGAPEVQKGEAAELEASNFVSGIAMVAVGAASGTGPSEKSRDHGDDKPGAVPDPTELASKTTNAIGTAESGRKLHTKEDKTKQPMANAAWEYSKVAMHVIGMICDTWEKLGNALSPTPPFHKNRLRERLAVMLVPLIFLTPYVTYNMIFGGISFGIGVGFFGQKWLVPAGQQGLEWLNTNYPNWPEWFDIANRFLRSAPTNAQLTLTLLRIAESQNAPLPPPPSTAPSNHIPPAAQGHGPNFQKGNDEEAELESSYIDTSEQQEQVSHQDSPKKASTKSKLVGLLRGTAKIGAGTVEGTHRLKAATVGGDVREKVGVLPPRVVRGHPAADGPNSFFARHHGRKGHVILDIDTSAGGPAAAHILFEPGREDGSKTKPATIEIEVSKISEIRKVGGLGWKGKLVAGWALGEDVPDGIEITLRSGEKFMFTAMPRRDELFDRLVAMSGQRWESL